MFSLVDLLGKKDVTVHFIGIGGISMSGLASILLKKGMTIQGSDSIRTSLTEKLENDGIKVFYGHYLENVTKDVCLVVKTSTVRDSNPEIVKAKELGIQIVERFELLDELIKIYRHSIGIAGSHGKTTTTSLAWKAFNSASLRPSFYVGSIIYDKNVTSNAFEDNIEYCVLETDESDSSFSKMTLSHGIVTNIDNDHLEFYGQSFEKLYSHFITFGQKIISKNGVLLIGTDNKQSARLCNELKWQNPTYGNIYTYSLLDKNADFYTSNLHSDGAEYVFNVMFRGVEVYTGVKIKSIGEYNVFNALAGISMCYLIGGNRARENLKQNQTNIYSGLLGVDKRFMFVGKYKNWDIVDDYAHHPKKIDTVIASVKDSKRWDRFVVVFEPHKYTRLSSIYEDFLKCFDKSDILYVMDIFGVPGGEGNNITKEKLFYDIKNSVAKGVDVICGSKNENITKELFDIASRPEFDNKKCLFLFVGAGFSSYFAKNLDKNMQVLEKQ